MAGITLIPFVAVQAPFELYSAEISEKQFLAPVLSSYCQPHPVLYPSPSVTVMSQYHVMPTGL